MATQRKCEMNVRRMGLRKRKWSFSAFVAAAVLAAILTMATALSVTDFLQLIFPQDGLSQGLSTETSTISQPNPVMRLLGGVYVALAAQGPRRALILYALLLLAIYGLKNLFSYLSSVFFAHVKTGILCDLRNTIHRSVLLQPFEGWSSQQQGQWLSRMSNDVAEYESNLLDSIQLLVQASLTMLIYLFMLLYLDWRLTLLVIAVMGVGTLLLSASRRLKRQSRLLQSLNGDLMSTTQETLDSLKEIKAATAIDYVNSRQQEQNRLFTNRRIALYRRIYAASPLSDFVGNSIVVAILIIGAYRVLGESASLSPALFVSYIMIYVLLLTPIKDFSNAIAQIKKGRGVEERLQDCFAESESWHCDKSVAQQKEPIEEVAFRDVSFSYGDHKVLERFNLQLPIHCHTALVGGSGSGKTTVARILVGLLQPQQGVVSINGAETSAESRIGRIAYIPQESMLFNDTIEANIRFGRSWVSDDDIERAVRMAQVGSILDHLPQGLQTVIGDGGGRLSGGERQRVNIARALAGNPEVLVMDEATAALDAATEQRFNEETDLLLKGRTVLVIAHRASTIANCDHVVRIQ